MIFKSSLQKGLAFKSDSRIWPDLVLYAKCGAHGCVTHND